MKIRILASLALLAFATFTTSASAYIFGPPNVTEIAESGENTNSIGLFSRSESYINTVGGNPFTYNSTGLAGVAKQGDNTGAFDFMYRLSQTKVNTSSTYKSFDIGLGIGGEWNMLNDRSLAILANLQFDEGAASDTGYDSFKLTLGGELGLAYRIFIGTATIAPFAMYNMYANTEAVTPTAGNDYSLYRNGNSTNLGVSFIFGALNLSFTTTTSNYKISNSVNNATANYSTNGTMITVGVNF